MNLDGNDYGIWINWSKNIFITNTLFFVNAFNSSQNVWNVWVGYRNCLWSWKNNNEMLTYIIDEKIWSYFNLWSIFGDRNKYIVSFAIKMPKNIHRYTLQHTLWYFLLLPSVWILGCWCFFLFRIKMAENIQSLMHSGLKMEKECNNK